MQRGNLFYKNYYQQVVYLILGMITAIICISLVLMYQILHRPLPVFSAVTQDRRAMTLVSYDEPNLMPATLIRWASKAAVAAYTFNFVDHTKQIAQARPYFTPGGWDAYQGAIDSTVTRVVKQQLFVYGVVTDPPVISSQGPGLQGYSWHIQIPFLATYQSAEQSRSTDYFVIVNVVKVPTTINPDAIGIESFEMRQVHGA
ncbi:MAG: DotI/IcmL/TraM family protein [Pseudomonadota bacterium]